MISVPTLAWEREIFDQGARWILAIDEVGRGAIAGPVAVGAVIIGNDVTSFPSGLRDSKLLSERARDTMAPLCEEWVQFSAVGLASAAEVDDRGIRSALGMASARAFAALASLGAPVEESVGLVDGNDDYVTDAIIEARQTDPAIRSCQRILTRVKGDRDCASISAASVIAKVHRDRLMIAEHARHPSYFWDRNKGYGTAQHFAAIEREGPSPIHRISWLKLSDHNDVETA